MTPHVKHWLRLLQRDKPIKKATRRNKYYPVDTGADPEKLLSQFDFPGGFTDYGQSQCLHRL